MILCGGGTFRPLINNNTTTLNRNKKKNHRFGISCLDTENEVQPSPNFEFLTKKTYVPPTWATKLDPIPSHVYSLGHYPTPIHKWNLPELPKNTEVYIKRDDLTGMQLSGNKVRKLEFLLADAVAQGKDSVITIGGLQSNHCRATAVAAKYLNLECHLILRTTENLIKEDPGLTGNLMVDRLAGAHVYLAKTDSEAEILTNFLKEELIKADKKPYVIPVGGSNSLGAWGYIEAIREIEMQLQKSGTSVPLSEKESGSNLEFFDYIVVACGSGGTIAGLSIGASLSKLKAKVRSFCISSTPDDFYEVAQSLLDGLQAKVNSREVVTIENATGDGYAVSKPEELIYIKEVAKATGVILDPVYSGKAAYGMRKAMDKTPSDWEGKKVLFVHTGGLLGLFGKTAEMTPLFEEYKTLEIHKAYISLCNRRMIQAN